MKTKLRKFLPVYRILFLIYTLLYLGEAVMEAVGKTHGPDLLEEFLGAVIIWGLFYLLGAVAGSLLYWTLALIISLMWYYKSVHHSSNALDDPSFLLDHENHDFKRKK